jgi:hypothetical protein
MGHEATQQWDAPYRHALRHTFSLQVLARPKFESDVPLVLGDLILETVSSEPWHNLYTTGRTSFRTCSM